MIPKVIHSVICTTAAALWAKTQGGNKATLLWGWSFSDHWLVFIRYFKYKVIVALGNRNKMTVKKRNKAKLSAKVKLFDAV